MNDAALVLTRPQPGLARSAQFFRAAGAQIRELPLLRIEAIAGATRKLPGPGDRDWLIFTSIHAVEQAAPYLDVDKRSRIAAVGQATAAALRAAGCPTVLLPTDRSGAKALLDCPELQDVAGASITVISGAGGRQLLGRRLRARGADVRKLSLYRRIPNPVSAAAFASACRPPCVLLLSSGEILNAWATLAQRYRRPEALALPLVVPSSRVVKLAARLGFRAEPWVPAQMSDRHVLQLLRDRGVLNRR